MAPAKQGPLARRARLASGDPLNPFGVVLAMILTPLLIGAYMGATLLRAVRGVATERWRGMLLLAISVVAALLISLIAGPWLHGYPTDKF
jgi:hypothetical protein